MFKHQIINKLIEERKTTKVNVAAYIGMSSSGFNKLTNGESMPGVDKLEKLADLFNLPTDYFFERNVSVDTPNIQIGHNVNGSGNTLSGDIALSECKTKLEHLQELIAGKDEQIELLKSQLEDKERLIQVLMTKI